MRGSSASGSCARTRRRRPTFVRRPARPNRPGTRRRPCPTTSSTIRPHRCPLSPPRPPFCGRGGGPRILAVAAREAAIVGLNANLRGGVAISDDAARSMAGAAADDRVARLGAAAGDRFDDLELQSFVGFTNFPDDRRSLAEMMAGAFGVSPEEALETPVVLAGTLEEMIDDVQARRERWGMSYVVVGVDVMEQFAPAVARLAGT